MAEFSPKQGLKAVAGATIYCSTFYDKV